MFYNKMSVDKMPEDKMPLYKMPLYKMPVYEMSGDKISLKKMYSYGPQHSSKWHTAEQWIKHFNSA